MATTASTTTRRKSLSTGISVANKVLPDPKGEAIDKAAAAEQGVTVVVPKPFKLNLDGEGTVIEYKAGTQEMPHSHANHWWSKANGVEVYKK